MEESAEPIPFTREDSSTAQRGLADNQFTRARTSRRRAESGGMPQTPKPSPLLTALSLNRGELDPTKLAALLAQITQPAR